jgi:hypothetical protein
VISPRRFAELAALCGTVVLAGWVAAGLAGLGSPGIENTGAPIEGRATSVTAHAEHVGALQATAMGEDGVSVADRGSGGAALPDSRPMPPPATPPVQIASLSPDPVQNEAQEAASSAEVADMGSGSGGAALPDPHPMRRPAALPVL